MGNYYTSSGRGRSQILLSPLYSAAPFESSFFPCFPPLSTFSLWIAPLILHVVIQFPCLVFALYSLVSYLGNPSCFKQKKAHLPPTRSSLVNRRQNSAPSLVSSAILYRKLICIQRLVNHFIIFLVWGRNNPFPRYLAAIIQTLADPILALMKGDYPHRLHPMAIVPSILPLLLPTHQSR
jgi:hypothetical protein